MSAAQQEEKQREWARIFAKAWNDPDFKKRLLADPATVLDQQGMTVSPGTQIKAVENTEQVFHVTVPLKPTAKRPVRFEEDEGETYSKAGAANSRVPWAGSNWCFFTYQVWCDGALRQRFLADPVEVMAEYDLPVPQEVEVRVVENTPDVRYLVLPAEPAERSRDLEQQAADAIPECQCPASRDLNRIRVGVLGKNGELFAFHEDVNLEIVAPDDPLRKGKPPLADSVATSGPGGRG